MRRPAERIVVVGSGPFAGDLVREFRRGAKRTASRVVAVVDDRELRPLTAASGRARLASIIGRFAPARILLALPEGRNALVERHMANLCGTASVIEDGIDAYARVTGKIPIERLANRGVMTGETFTHCVALRLIRRMIDLVMATLGLFVCAPLCIAIGVAIKLDCGGSVFFVQDRIGRHGEPFRMLKFRTMHATPASSQWVRDNASRITRVGRWLRRFRLDEIPQLGNVLRGEMSLVGPRPHPVSNLEMFAQEIPFYSIRTRVRPGITGWAQVKYGYANDLVEETEKVRYDLFYVNNASLWLDLRVLFETVKTVLLARDFESASRIS